MKKIIAVVILIALIVSLVIFNIDSKGSRQEQTIRVVYTADLSGAPILVMEKMNLIKQYNSDVKITVTPLSPGSAINEAFIAGQTDIGHLGIPNVLVGIDKGIPYKIMSSVANTEGGLQTNNLKIKSLKDIGSDDKIAVPSLTSTSTMQLHILAEKELGDYNALENNLIVMSDDNAITALINKSGISMHMTQFTNRIRENQAGLPTVISSQNISQGIVMEKYCVASVDFYEKHRELYEAFYSALKDAVKLINDKDEEALNIMAAEYGFDKEILINYLNLGYITYLNDSYNIEPYVDMAYKMGLISKKREISEMIFKKD